MKLFTDRKRDEPTERTSDGWLAALKRERAYAVADGNTERVAEVDKEIERTERARERAGIGSEDPVERAVDAAPERAEPTKRKPTRRKPTTKE